MQSKREMIAAGRTTLGIELGSTTIKSVLIGENHEALAIGSHEWENKLADGIWTYSMADVWEGVQQSYKNMAGQVKAKYGIAVEVIGAIGFSGMMHGYIACDASGDLLVPFRTWRNTTTGQAAAKLTAMFNFNIPQRWSSAHLYQAILNKESHVNDIAFITTLAGYVHWKLTGEKVLGTGEASGMFPVDSEKNDYKESFLDIFDAEVKRHDIKWQIRDILPKVLPAGEKAGALTDEGALLLDPTGTLKAGIPMCPPEGDAGTGMVATNSITVRTGNVSAGTSVFAMIVMEKELSRLYPEIDIVSTPDGKLVAMVHCNNCTSDINAWINLFDDMLKALGLEVGRTQLFEAFFTKALEGEADGGGLLSYNYLSGEHMTGLAEGRPLLVRMPDSRFNLANFARVNLYSALATLKIGMDMLIENESIGIDSLIGHGGFFKTKEVGQRFMAAAFGVPVSVMENAGEGGAWGIAILASYMINKSVDEALPDYLSQKVFAGSKCTTVVPVTDDIAGFADFVEKYKKGLDIERTAVKLLV